VFPDHFFRGVALEAVCAGVPAQDVAVGVEREDSVLVDALNEQAEKIDTLVFVPDGALRTIGARKGTREINTRSGALVVIDKANPTSVYFAFPNQQFQVEVFDPRASRARRVVLGGQAQRVR